MKSERKAWFNRVKSSTLHGAVQYLVISVLVISLFGFMSCTGKKDADAQSGRAASSSSKKIFPQPRTIRVLRSEHPAYPFDKNSISIQEIFEKTRAL